jgi:hypothetical protein
MSLDHAQQKLAAFLHQQGLTNPDVSIAVVERFERQAGSGKVKETRRCAPTQGGERRACAFLREARDHRRTERVT